MALFLVKGSPKLSTAREHAYVDVPLRYEHGPPEDIYASDEKRLPHRDSRRHQFGVILWVTLVQSIFWLLLLFAVREKASRPGLLPLELSHFADALEYETVIFDPSGFGDDGPVTPYEGAPTPENDKLWHELSNVGIYSLTKEQNDALPYPSPEGPEPGEYYVVIEVFHQLHCLNFLRQQVYTNGYDPNGNRTDHIHVDHCVDYLRQVLMCHGDVTPFTHFYRPGVFRDWWPDFAIPHTCRRWDLIFEQARKANNTGMTIE